uniref:DUF1329 domain-containing protein n=1 Tax=Marinobacterium profundum TaxID=1714300 RepID=UPI00083162AC|nr:DUF1329 domain-containing protein [Marinobacterium profundum]
MNINKTILNFTIVGVLSGFQFSYAAVAVDEAAQLSSSLTPLGGEKAGNADGTIPEWTGGTAKLPVQGENYIPWEFLSDDQPIVKINSKNIKQFSDKLSPGTIALLEKYPDSFYLNVYPTRRTASAPDYVYENTRDNALNCKLSAAQDSVEGCFGGIPFPIPKSGLEIIWNYLLRVEATATEYGFKNLLLLKDSEPTLATRNDNYWQYPYYYRDGSADKWSGEYFLQRFTTTEPPFKSGESLVIRDSIDPSEPRRAWQYLLGQRRVRRAPTVGYDTPDFVSSGANYFDEVQGFFGMPDRYDWTIVEKRETYIPYNSNGLVTAQIEDAFVANHLNPAEMRWELHRTWVVEATVKSDKRHAVPKRVFYFDEDSWLLTLLDGYDSEGSLWRTSQVFPFVVPSVPVTLVKPVSVYDLQADTVSNVQFLNGETFRIVSNKPETFFTGDAVAAEASR